MTYVIIAILFYISETLHAEFSRRILEELKNHYNFHEEQKTNANHEETIEESEKYPIVCSDDCKTITQWDNLENLVDVKDGFLMAAMQPFLTELKVPEKLEKPTLFEEFRAFHFEHFLFFLYLNLQNFQNIQQ